MNYNLLPWKDYLTLGFAALGAGLGIMNTWSAINQRRVRLRVRPMYAQSISDGRMMFAVEVVNLSSFAVTIDETGITVDGSSLKKGLRSSGRRAANIPPLLLGDQAWPRRLASRESVTTYLDPTSLEPGYKLGRAYAKTACGEARYGTSPALKDLRKIHASLRSA